MCRGERWEPHSFATGARTASQRQRRTRKRKPAPNVEPGWSAPQTEDARSRIQPTPVTIPPGQTGFRHRPGDSVPPSKRYGEHPVIDLYLTEIHCRGTRGTNGGHPRPCTRRLFDCALPLGSVVEVKCDICNAKYAVAMTTMGLLVADRRFVTYTRVAEAMSGLPENPRSPREDVTEKAVRP